MFIVFHAGERARTKIMKVCVGGGHGDAQWGNQTRRGACAAEPQLEVARWMCRRSTHWRLLVLVLCCQGAWRHSNGHDAPYRGGVQRQWCHS